MKKFALFLFAVGIGMSAMAGGQDCYQACDEAQDACLDAGTNPRGCIYRWEKCYAACNTAPGV